MSDVYLCSPTNSQMFTTCCETAICSDEQKCPRCGIDVYPFFEGMSDKDRDEYSGGYWHSNTDRMRWKRAYKK